MSSPSLGTVASRMRKDSALRDCLIVLIWAFGLRMLFLTLTSDTYDPDEFVILHLSREVASGAVPYRDFMFFHPPGVLLFFRYLQPVVGLWWPSARIIVALLDTATALFVWRIGRHLHGGREGRIAGLLYAANPLALVCGVRVVQDPIVTALGMGALCIFLLRRSHASAAVAGLCLAIACFVKYPAVLFLPVFVLVSPRRAITLLASFSAALLALVAPYWHEIRALYDQTVVWQLSHRTPSSPGGRIGALVAFWLVVNPFAAPAALHRRPPPWLAVGFGVGVLFLLASQVYYHYFVPILPFAALMSAPLVGALVARAPRVPRVLGAAAVALTVLWAVDLNTSDGPSRFFVTATHLSSISSTVQLLDRWTGPSKPILTDQYEYAYLAHRVPINYFWNMHGLVHAGILERDLSRAGAVVLTERVAPTYPAGFTTYLTQHAYLEVRTGTTRIWLMSPPSRIPGAGSSVQIAPGQTPQVPGTLALGSARRHSIG